MKRSGPGGGRIALCRPLTSAVFAALSVTARMKRLGDQFC